MRKRPFNRPFVGPPQFEAASTGVVSREVYRGARDERQRHPLTSRSRSALYHTGAIRVAHASREYGASVACN